jgi:hypothetical protein
LRDEPVAARPPSASYRLRKYARRHRIAVGVAAGLVVLLTAFTVLQGRHECAVIRCVFRTKPISVPA